MSVAKGLEAPAPGKISALVKIRRNLWDLDIQPQSESSNTWRHRNIYAAAVKSTGAPMDFIAETDDFSKYAFVVAPGYQLASPELVEKWQNFVEQGGHLILSCRSGMKDGNGHFLAAKWAAPIAGLTGADLDYFDMLLPDGNATVRTGSQS